MSINHLPPAAPAAPSPGSNSPLQDACVPATSRPNDGTRACQQEVNAIVNRNPETCYIVSAQRLKHAAGLPGPWAERMAAAVRDLDHVHLPLRDIDAERLDEAMSLLREHAPLRGLAITGSLFWSRPVETALAEVLQFHKDRLEDLILTLPLGFPPALTEAIGGLGGLQSLSLHNPPESPADADSARRLAEALWALPNLRSLEVTGIGDTAALTACLSRLAPGSVRQQAAGRRHHAPGRRPRKTAATAGTESAACRPGCSRYRPARGREAGVAALE